MSSTSTPKSVSLEELLRHNDIWRGHSYRFRPRTCLDTGHPPLNDQLLHGGWPLGSLTEVCQQGFQGEWQLFLPAMLRISPGLIVLLNPPAEPFSQTLIQAGIDLDRLVIVDAEDRSSFLAAFSTLARTASFGAVFAWQPQSGLSYTHLRKCQLAASEGSGLYVIFRPSAVQQQSSPASLRLFSQILPDCLALTIFKQKGVLQRHQSHPVTLPLPGAWHPDLPYEVVTTETQSRGRSVLSTARKVTAIGPTPRKRIRAPQAGVTNGKPSGNAG